MGANNLGPALNTWSTNDWIVLTSAIIIMLAAVITIPRWLIFNAMKRIIKIMKKQNVFNPQNARSAEEMGIAPLTIWGRMFKMRDYRPQALQHLTELRIVLQTQDGKYYINQEILSTSRLKDV